MSSDAFRERRISPVHVTCPDCGTQKMRRLPRLGFLQKKLWPLFGLYPWECPICRKTRLVQRRKPDHGHI